MVKRLKEGETRLEQWRMAVAATLRERWPAATDLDVTAATIIGMFDAGARDREVADFLVLDVAHRSVASVSANELLDLASHLHRLAASRPSV
jgi:hypothetical protein